MALQATRTIIAMTMHINIATHMTKSTVVPISEHGFSDTATNADVTGQLLMLASSNLPIGSYTYSQGIEPAIESGLIHDEKSTLVFMSDYLELALFGYELPLLALMLESLNADNDTLAEALGADYHANRESKEFSYESTQLAVSLSAWLDEVLNLDVPNSLIAHGFLPLFANISAHWAIPAQQAMTTYAFGQIENMVLAAVKTVPLGQMAGQRIIWQLQQQLSHHAIRIAVDVDRVYQQHHSSQNHQNTETTSAIRTLYRQLNMSANLPNLARLSCQHERQYSRLFRS